MTPKSLLRLPQAGSRLEDLAEGRWHPVLDDPWAASRAEEITRVVLCTGKIYYDLLAEAEKLDGRRPAIVRLEQLYSFPWAEARAVLARYPAARGAVWVQEEPRNMGAWSYLAPEAGRSSRPRASRWATSAGPSGPARPRATRRRTRPSRAGSSARRWRPAGGQSGAADDGGREIEGLKPRSDHRVEQPQRAVGHGPEGQVARQPAGVGLPRETRAVPA